MNDSPTPTPSPEPKPAETPTPTETPKEEPKSEEKPSLIGGKPEEKPADKPKDEGKPEDKPKDEPPPALTVEDFKDLENFKADDPFLKDFVGIMNNTELDAKARSAELLKLQTNLMKDFSERGQQAFIQTREGWQSEVAKLPEFANGKLEPALGGISKLVERFGSAETRQAFDLTGAGDHPAIIKFLHNIAKVIGEPTGDDPKPNPGPRSESDRAQILYPSS